MARLPRIAADGTAVLLVDQDVEQALSVAARGYVLETGHVVLEGESGTLLADPGVRGLPGHRVTEGGFTGCH